MAPVRELFSRIPGTEVGAVLFRLARKWGCWEAPRRGCAGRLGVLEARARGALGERACLIKFNCV